MTASTLNVAKTANSRVFIMEGRAHPYVKPGYHAYVKMTAVTQNFGAVTKIEVPDPNEYGKFLNAGQLRGATENATTTLVGRYAMELQSDLLKLARKGCATDVQLHFGECKPPSEFNAFSKAIVMENVIITSFKTGDLGALASGENAVIDETVEISADNLYEVLPLWYAERAATIVTNEVIDVTIADSAACGTCGTESDGCMKIYAISTAAGGSPTTPADIVYSLDKGVTWRADDIDELSAAQAPDGIAGVGQYICIVSNAAGSMCYILKSLLDGLTPPDFSEITTGFVAAGPPNAIFGYGSTGFIVGNGGYVYYFTNPGDGVTVADAGAATVDDLLAIHGLSDQQLVAVGKSGAVIYTRNGTTWTAAAARPVGAGVNLNTVWMKGEDEWIVGTSTGRLYYTKDAGASWTEKSFPGSGAGRVDSVKFSTDSIGFMAHATAAPRGRILRTYDGGYSWNVEPASTGSVPLNDRFNALAVCTNDPNFVVAVGLADNGSDGIIVTGQPG